MKLLCSVLCGLFLIVTSARGEQPEQKKELDTLLKDLESKDREVRLAAVMGLAEYGPEANKAVPGLVAALQEKDVEMQLNAAIALGKIGKAGVAPVAKLLGKAEADTKNYALA